MQAILNYGLPSAPVCHTARKKVSEQVQKWRDDRIKTIPVKPYLTCSKPDCRKKVPRDEIIYFGYPGKTKVKYCKECFAKRIPRGEYGVR